MYTFLQPLLEKSGISGRKRLAAIERVAKGEAEAGGAEKMSLVAMYESTSAVYNDQILTRHLAGTLEGALGKSNVVVLAPVMGSENYSVFVEQGVPSFFFRLGVADPDALARARASHKELPSVHSPLFAPVAGPALRTGIMAEVVLLRDLLKGNDVNLSRITERKQGGK